MKEIYKQELKEFEKYNFREFVLEDIKNFYIAKEKYIENHEDDFIHSKFDLAYTSLKSQWVCGKISENTFWHLVGILRQGVVV